MKMTMKEIMHRRHGVFNSVHDNGGIFFDMENFWIIVDKNGRKLPKDKWEKIEIIDKKGD